MKTRVILLVATASIACASAPAAAKAGDPWVIGEGVSFDLSAASRLRYEAVDQDNGSPSADAVTIRLRLGGELKVSNFSVLVEGEGTAALDDSYNDTIPSNGIEPFPVVADPENLELNRLQASWMEDGNGVTVGRQRIILDNARFVGNVGWRQNEQTFDAVRGQGKIGPVSLDATYSKSQRTIFGVDSPNEYFDGDIVLLNGGVKVPVVEAKAFAYLIDYDTRITFSSATYGAFAKAEFELPGVKLSATASFATQSAYGDNPVDYSADYLNGEIGASIAGFTITAGFEELGSDVGVAAFQTPLATLHAFNGWADLFLTTPSTGLRDYYVRVGTSNGIPMLPGFNAAVTYHEFDSDFGGLDYGSEWDASLGFKVGPVSLLAKYANYNSDGFAVDTEKFWLQAEFGF